VIEVRNLTKRFGETVAVDDLSFSVRQGMVTGFLGPNGAGKSTTMRMILGLDRPTSGEATIAGRAYVEAPVPLNEVGALLDARDVHGGRRGRDHLRALARSNGLPKGRVDEVLDMVGLASVARKRVKGYSLGMSQRLGIAAALLGDPEVLLFDEPVNGLDPEGILWIRTLMRSLAAEGKTILVSSHLMSEMAQTADHLLVIGRGRLLADVSAAEFVDGHRDGRGSLVLVRSPALDELERLLLQRGRSVERSDGGLRVRGAEPAEVGDVAAAHGIAIHELRREQASLEAAFMAMTRDSVEFAAEPPSDDGVLREGS
jgi:ABC-2 type transport system ATP-binding protein